MSLKLSQYRTLFYIYVISLLVYYSILSNTVYAGTLNGIKKIIGLSTSSGYGIVGSSGYSGYYTFGSDSAVSSTISNYLGLSSMVKFAPVLIFISLLLAGISLNISGINKLKVGESGAWFTIMLGCISFAVALIIFPVILAFVDYLINM